MLSDSAPRSGFRRRCRRRPLRLKSLQALNTYELTGANERQPGIALDDLILEHLTVQKELRKLNAREEVVLRMRVEGYTHPEIAQELNVSLRTVYLIQRDLRASLERAHAA